MRSFPATNILLSRIDVNTNLFLNPPDTGSSGPDNSKWTIGTTQHVRWSTEFTNFDFLLYQHLGCGDHTCVNGPFLIAENLTSETKTWDWQVTTGTLTTKPTNTFFLRMRNFNGETEEFDSSTLDFTSSALAGGVGSTTKSTLPVSTKSSSTAVAVTSSSTKTSASNIPTNSTPPGTTTVSISPSAIVTSQVSTETNVSISTATRSPSPTGFNVPTSTPTSPPSDTRDLPSAAKVGLIIGIIFAVVLAIFLGWYLGRRRKNRSKKLPADSFKPQDSVPPVQLSELQVPGWGDRNSIPLPFTPRELHANGKFDSFQGVRELDAEREPCELDSFKDVRELDAWKAPGELGDGRRSGVKSGVYELGPRYT